MNIRLVLAIAKKEFFSFINSPFSFIIIVPFLFISTFLYFRTSFVAGEASLRSYFDLLPWFLVLLAPALSMKLLTDEQKSGTIELLFAHPISEIDIIAGKFAGSFLFFLVILGTTLALPVSLVVFANPDPGILIAQYLGAALVGGVFLSLGILASSYIPNVIGSFLLAASSSFLLILVGIDFVTLMFPWPFSRIAEELGVMAHMNNVARGLFDIRDILYFVSIIGIFLTASVMKLSQRRLAEDKREKRKLVFALFLIAAIGIGLNVFMSVYPLRVDLTQQKLFTLSPATKQTIRNLPDIVTVSVFASRSLPGEMQLTLKEVRDTLKDYSRYGKNIRITTYSPETDPEAAQKAQQAGIQEVTFNRIGSGKFEAQRGMLGLTIRYADKTETMPFIQDTTDFEYQLTRRIRKLTQDKEQKVGLYKNTSGGYQIIEELLKTQYTVEDLTITSLQDKDKLQALSGVITIDDASSESTASSSLTQYLNNGGNVLLLTNGVWVNQQTASASKGKPNYENLLSAFGMHVANNLVYDLQLNELLTFGDGQVRYAAPYPFWLRAIPEENKSQLTSGLKSVTLGWPSSLELNDTNGIIHTKLLTTSRNAGAQKDSFTITPQDAAKLASSSETSYLLAASAEKGATRLVVIGDSQFASDQFLQNFQENIVFLSNSIDYIALDKDVLAIPRKASARAVYRFTNPLQPMVFQYGNIFAAPIVVIAFAIVWISRRKRRTKRTYEQSL